MGSPLDDALQLLLHNPFVGFTRPLILAHHRFFPAGEHLIAYRIASTRVEVSRILHGKMDVKDKL
ncbi:MAG TPA: type II toxin-antitoxin system RelE/ParE family toxin [Burkholderiales bacterium]|nr:type II toxin-antitoxin system RelE/ParE family toxin [Burkholderiales bacterium]